MISYREKLATKSPEFQKKVRELKIEMMADYLERSRAEMPGLKHNSEVGVPDTKPKAGCEGKLAEKWSPSE